MHPAYIYSYLEGVMVKPNQEHDEHEAERWANLVHGYLERKGTNQNIPLKKL